MEVDSPMTLLCCLRCSHHTETEAQRAHHLEHGGQITLEGVEAITAHA